VTISSLSRRFGSRVALNDVSLYVPKGSVFGLVGENGAGKTTLIKHILGLLRAQTGSVHVFGMDPVADCVKVLARIGYLSEQPDLPGWMRVDEFLRYTSAFYPLWNSGYAEQLRTRFGLEASAKIKTLSKGQQAKAGLLAAQAHRPDLLLLDEPSSGLDPIVRKEILEAVIRTVADEGRTVFFSSHLLEEIERVCDHIAMLQNGRVVLAGNLDDIKAQHRSVMVELHAPTEHLPLPGMIAITGHGRDWQVLCNGAREQLPGLVAGIGGRIVEERAPSLSEIFVGHATRKAANKPGDHGVLV
jgi:ABC-2 type transport system ATP-binding protein